MQEITVDKIDVEEIYTLWSGLCTKLRIKDLLRYDSYNNIELKFRNSLETDNIPEVKIYFSSEENSCED